MNSRITNPTALLGLSGIVFLAHLAIHIPGFYPSSMVLMEQ
jgi:hypothetical protein